jgi:hypothetical protein
MITKTLSHNGSHVQVSDGKKTLSVRTTDYVLTEDDVLIAAAQTKDELLSEIKDPYYFGRITQIVPVESIPECYFREIEKGFR